MQIGSLSFAYMKKTEGKNMLNLAITFFIIAIIAAVLGFSGIAGAATNIAVILFVIFLVLFVVAAIVHALKGKKPI